MAAGLLQAKQGPALVAMDRPTVPPSYSNGMLAGFHCSNFISVMNEDG